jgi:hypothetical protein
MEPFLFDWLGGLRLPEREDRRRELQYEVLAPRLAWGGPTFLFIFIITLSSSSSGVKELTLQADCL